MLNAGIIIALLPEKTDVKDPTLTLNLNNLNL